MRLREKYSQQYGNDSTISQDFEQIQLQMVGSCLSSEKNHLTRERSLLFRRAFPAALVFGFSSESKISRRFFTVIIGVFSRSPRILMTMIAQSVHGSHRWTRPLRQSHVLRKPSQLEFPKTRRQAEVPFMDRFSHPNHFASTAATRPTFLT